VSAVNEAWAKRHVVLAAAPLAVIASGILVSPLVVLGYPEHMRMIVRPYEDGLSPFFAIYLAAAVLAVLSWRAARRPEPARSHITIAVVSTIAVLATMAIPVGFYIDGGYLGDALLFALPLAVSVWFLVRGLRHRGWTRMLWLLGAFAAAALPYGCPLIPGMFNLFSGGLVFELADLTVLALAVLGIVRAAR
jgi:hypothetical protein